MTHNNDLDSLPQQRARAVAAITTLHHIFTNTMPGITADIRGACQPIIAYCHAATLAAPVAPGEIIENPVVLLADMIFEVHQLLNVLEGTRAYVIGMNDAHGVPE